MRTERDPDISYGAARRVPSRPVSRSRGLHYLISRADNRYVMSKSSGEKEFARNARRDTGARGRGMRKGPLNGPLRRDAYPVAPRACTQKFRGGLFSALCVRGPAFFFPSSLHLPRSNRPLWSGVPCAAGHECGQCTWAPKAPCHALRLSSMTA